MNAFLERAGLFRFVFVALLVLFNWPVLSIPAPENRLAWLFGVWLLAIVLLWLAAHMVSTSAGAGSTVSPPSSSSLPPLPVSAPAPGSMPEGQPEAPQSVMPPKIPDNADV